MYFFLPCIITSNNASITWIPVCSSSFFYCFLLLDPEDIRSIGIFSKGTVPWVAGVFLFRISACFLCCVLVLFLSVSF